MEATGLGLAGLTGLPKSKCLIVSFLFNQIFGILKRKCLIISFFKICSLKVDKISKVKNKRDITANFWCDSHFTSINTCREWRARTEDEVSRKEFHTHIYLN